MNVNSEPYREGSRASWFEVNVVDKIERNWVNIIVKLHTSAFMRTPKHCATPIAHPKRSTLFIINHHSAVFSLPCLAFSCLVVWLNITSQGGAFANWLPFWLLVRLLLYLVGKLTASLVVTRRSKEALNDFGDHRFARSILFPEAELLNSTTKVESPEANR